MLLVLIFLVSQISAAEVSRDSQDAVFETFASWMRENGAVFNMTVKDDEDTGRTAIITADVQQGERFLEVPESLILCSDNYDPNIELFRQAAEKLDHRYPFVSRMSKAALTLLVEVYKGEASFFSRYLALLPRMEPDYHPYLWSDAQLDFAAKAVPGVEDVIHRKNVLFQIYSHTRLFVSSTLFPRDSDFFSFERFLWAFVVILTRNFGFKENHCLVPLVDMLNHAGEDASNVEFGTQAETRTDGHKAITTPTLFYLTASAQLPKETVLSATYTHTYMNTRSTFSRYGFVSPLADNDDTDFDHLFLQPEPSPDRRVISAVHSTLSREKGDLRYGMMSMAVKCSESLRALKPAARSLCLTDKELQMVDEYAYWRPGVNSTPPNSTFSYTKREDIEVRALQLISQGLARRKRKLDELQQYLLSSLSGSGSSAPHFSARMARVLLNYIQNGLKLLNRTASCVRQEYLAFLK